MEITSQQLLNREQQEAVTAIRDYLDGKLPDLEYVTVSGPGGSGKTFMLKYALNNYDRSKILSVTISHFAKKVLQDNLGENYTTGTVASMLGLILTYDTVTGKEKMVASTSMPKIQKYDIVVIDEVSMIDDKVYDMILSHGKKIIAVGDKYQLPPVEQDHDSKFFDNINVELVQVIRFNLQIKKLSSIFVSEIARYNEGYNIKKDILTLKTKRHSELDEHGAGYIFINSLKQLLTYAYQDFKRDLTNVNSCRIIAYKNKTIDKLNDKIRMLLFGKKARRFEIGELIISQGGYGSFITNGDVFRVTGVKDIVDSNNIKCHILTVNVNMPIPIIVVADEGMQEYTEIEEYLREQANSTANWKPYKEFTGAYAKFKYSYAVSTHKAQGSSIDNVYVFEADIMNVGPISIKEKFQSLYVAVTRARHRVYIYNKNSKIDNSGITINKNKYKDESS